ncbi:Carbonic anhydrase [Alkalibacterium sp. AK22]|uniref:carbonic anhydrase n=1 Tax=Alkalibacterium sp. AK22 TaxID=1229520 RepID=UPI00044BFF92|nr:carbonic anhydrase [Alkalibacterium sp. AK22]EXJ24317.1 Carbonic anhydrase [Alkalibacterium sp. AK22]
MLERLKTGLKTFREVTYKRYEHIYRDLEATQDPHTLFIGCSDSRVSPDILLDSDPGEVFTVRNIANTVPAYENSQNDLPTVSSIEYAIEVLGVEEVVICGHSNCGGCAAAMGQSSKLDKLPFTQQYLKPLACVKEKIEAEPEITDAKAKARLMEKMNVIEQVKHLKSYPIVQEKLKKGELEIEGWYFDIKSGSVSVYDEKADRFCRSEDYQAVRV